MKLLYVSSLIYVLESEYLRWHFKFGWQQLSEKKVDPFHSESVVKTLKWFMRFVIPFSFSDWQSRKSFTRCGWFRDQYSSHCCSSCSKAIYFTSHWWDIIRGKLYRLFFHDKRINCNALKNYRMIHQTSKIWYINIDAHLKFSWSVDKCPYEMQSIFRH